MNLFQLRAVCAALFDKDDPSSFTIGGVDMFLMAANNAKKEAELLHDFEYSRITAEIDVTSGPEGGSLTGLTLVGEATRGLKSITSVRNASGVPLDFSTVDTALERDRGIDDRSDLVTGLRYPADWMFASLGTASRGIVQRGRKLYIYPLNLLSETSPETVTITVEGYGFLPAYTDAQISEGTPDDTPEDFMLEFGGLYMQWATVVQLNYIFQKFLPRSEGTLSAPESAKKDALANLVLWDDYIPVGTFHSPR